MQGKAVHTGELGVGGEKGEAVHTGMCWEKQFAPVDCGEISSHQGILGLGKLVRPGERWETPFALEHGGGEKSSGYQCMLGKSVRTGELWGESGLYWSMLGKAVRPRELWEKRFILEHAGGKEPFAQVHAGKKDISTHACWEKRSVYQCMLG